MTTATVPTTAERLRDVESELQRLAIVRGQMREALEDALALDQNVTALRRDILKIDAAGEEAESARRGLARRRVVEQRAELQRSAEDATVAKTAALETFHRLISERDKCSIELGRLEFDVQKSGLESDAAANRDFHRQKTLAAFVATNSETLSRADQLAANADSPAELMNAK